MNDYDKVYAQYKDEIERLNDRLAMLRKERKQRIRSGQPVGLTNKKISKARTKLEKIEAELVKAMGDPYSEVQLIDDTVEGSKYTSYYEAYQRPFQAGKFSPK